MTAGPSSKLFVSICAGVTLEVVGVDGFDLFVLPVASQYMHTKAIRIRFSEVLSSSLPLHIPLSFQLLPPPSLQVVEGALPVGTRVVRAMPNTPCLVGEAAVGFARGAASPVNDAALTSALFKVPFGLEKKLLA